MIVTVLEDDGLLIFVSWVDKHAVMVSSKSRYKQVFVINHLASMQWLCEEQLFNTIIRMVVKSAMIGLKFAIVILKPTVCVRLNLES